MAVTTVRTQALNLSMSFAQTGLVVPIQSMAGERWPA
jgi:hypothetical protein